jgi:hypothetical protein
MSAGSLAAFGLAAMLAAQDGGGPCSATDPTLYLDSPGAEGGVLTKRFLEGEVLEIDVIARLRTALPDPKDGVQGYSISVVHGPGLELKELSTEGLNIIADRGFESTRAAKNASGEGFLRRGVHQRRRGLRLHAAARRRLPPGPGEISRHLRRGAPDRA